MQFGPLPLDQALDSIMAHTVRLPGRGAIKKGHVLTATDLAALRSAGVVEVVVARLETGDIGEDAAAALTARALAGSQIEVGDASTGRANLRSATHGLVVVDAARVERLNRIDESLTVATQTPHTPVLAGDLVATVKVIPFGAPARAVEQWVALCREGEAVLEIAPFVPHRVGLIATRRGDTSKSVLDRAIEAVSARIARLGSHVDRVSRCDHEPAPVAEAIHDLVSQHVDLILVIGASATVDRRDVVPAAILQAGGRVDHFGIPVDPGNLLLLGQCQGTTVIGVPGCARSLKPSGFDRILERRLANLPVTGESLSGMGVGGLMKEIPSRPLPRAGQRKEPARMPGPRIAAVLLAAGMSRRMGGSNKLLAEVDGSPMIARVVETLRRSRVQPIVVVTGHDATAVEAALAGLPIRVVHNPDHARGLSTSLRVGLQALETDRDGVLVMLGDMPWVASSTIEALLDAFEANGEGSICVPTYDRKRGNPVLWPARYFDEMKALAGDVGARHLLAQYDDEVCEVEVDDAGVLRDVDITDDLP
ncbi:MAG: 4-diphosphocytidyl-2C-methyl-D-erythritol kinase [Gemmatimonadales bacterium]|nr:MAG: 4-diphosphocytidyl-2C-methyl-D-erythritol kinase [Gemmatimonadales bacterium]